MGHRRNLPCPVENNFCNRPNNIYNAEITTEDKTYNYIGMSAPPLRLRVATHIYSFKNSSNQTTLSTKVKELIEKNINHNVKFKLIENSKPYTPELKRCGLCTAEAYHILYSRMENLLNSKLEIISKCRHKVKFKLGVNG